MQDTDPGESLLEGLKAGLEVLLVLLQGLANYLNSTEVNCPALLLGKVAEMHDLMWIDAHQRSANHIYSKGIAPGYHHPYLPSILRILPEPLHAHRAIDQRIAGAYHGVEIHNGQIQSQPVGLPLLRPGHDALHVLQAKGHVRPDMALEHREADDDIALQRRLCDPHLVHYMGLVNRNLLKGVTVQIAQFDPQPAGNFQCPGLLKGLLGAMAWKIISRAGPVSYNEGPWTELKDYLGHPHPPSLS